MCRLMSNNIPFDFGEKAVDIPFNFGEKPKYDIPFNFDINRDDDVSSRTLVANLEVNDVNANYVSENISNNVG